MQISVARYAVELDGKVVARFESSSLAIMRLEQIMEAGDWLTLCIINVRAIDQASAGLDKIKEAVFA